MQCCAPLCADVSSPWDFHAQLCDQWTAWDDGVWQRNSRGILVVGQDLQRAGESGATQAHTCARAHARTHTQHMPTHTQHTHPHAHITHNHTQITSRHQSTQQCVFNDELFAVTSGPDGAVTLKPVGTSGYYWFKGTRGKDAAGETMYNGSFYNPSNELCGTWSALSGAPAKAPACLSGETGCVVSLG